MKVKEINRTANVAWSPSQQYPIYLAAGTAAQQLDATFSTSAALDIFHLDLSSHDLAMPAVGSLPCDHRFNKFIWGSFGIQEGEHKAGTLIGGTDNGEIVVWDADKIISGNAEDALIHNITQHSGPVHSLDINPFQSNLLASGGVTSEIYVVDLRNPANPLAPGNKSLPPDVISCVAWNKTVQHILGTACPGSGKVIVWDLRKNEPIIKVGDASSVMHCKSMAWHPEVATQLVMASEDDRYPVIQMWDLRFAASPMRLFEGHQRGILSLTWCLQDPDLLMSCGKDNRILCWNPNTEIPGGEILYELPTTSQWNFDVQWCPRNPGLVATTSFDGHVTVSSLLGGGAAPHSQQDQVTDSFGTMDLGSLPPNLQQRQLQQQQQQQKPEPLKKTPRWMKRPCAARFGFGGKLVSFGNFNDTPAKQIFVSQVITEEEFLKRSCELENALLTGQLVEFCELKTNSATDPVEKTLWSFLKVNFDKEPRLKFLDLLGYDPKELSKKICAFSTVPKSPTSGIDSAVDAEELASKMELLSAKGDNQLKADGLLFSSGSASPAVPESKTPGSDTDGTAAFDAIAASGIIPPVGSVDPTNDEGRPASPLTISTEDDTDGLVSQALLTGNFEAAVEVCFKSERLADALLLGIAGGPELFARTQRIYLEQAKSTVSRLISSVVNRDWRTIVETCAIDNWREALAALITYAKAEEFSELCDILGERLESEDKQYSSAMVCYICGGNVERLVACWSSDVKNESSALVLQDLIEKVMVLRKAVECERKQNSEAVDSYLGKQISNYANILASQGCYQTAMVYLSTINDPTVAVLKDRVFKAQRQGQDGSIIPEFPFASINVLATPVQQTHPTQPQAQPAQQQLPNKPGPYQPNMFSPSQPTQPTPFYNPAVPPQNPGMYQPPPSSMSVPPQPNYSAPPPDAGLHSGGPAIFTPSSSQPPALFQPYMNQGPTFTPASTVPSAMKVEPPPLPGAQTFPPSMPHGTAKQDVSPVSAPPMPMNLYNPAEMQQRQPQFMGQGFLGSQGQQVQPGAVPSSVPVPFPGPPSSAGAPLLTGPPQPSGPPIPNVSGFQPRPHLATQPPVQNNIPPGMFIPNATPLPPEEKKIPPEPVQKEVIKPPIPGEHMIVQEVFNALVDRCKNAGKNPQMKRKLEDVGRRLEALYDMLREEKLSANVLGGLHHMVQACQNGDYQSGLQIHTQMIASGNFSEISAFMPGLKTLMQIATQLRV